MSAFRYTYKLCESHCVLEEMHYTGYGISVIDEALGAEIMRIEDISTSRLHIEKLIEDCNRLCLSPIHLCDVVEDFI